MFRRLAAEHGPLMNLQLGEIHFIIISSVAFAKQMMRTHDINFANRTSILVGDMLTYNYSDMVAAPYGDQWRHLRKICSLELLNAARVQSFRPIREQECLNFCKKIASLEGSPANLSDDLYLMAYDVTTRAVVGNKTKERGVMTSIILEVTHLASGFMLADLYPSVKWLPWITGDQMKIQRIYRKIDRLLDSIIEEHKADKAAGDGGKVDDLMDVLLRIQQDGTEYPLTTENIKAVILVCASSFSILWRNAKYRII